MIKRVYQYRQLHWYPDIKNPQHPCFFVDLITQLGNVPEDTVLTTSADVMACAFEWNIAKEEEFTEIVQKRNAEIN